MLLHPRSLAEVLLRPRNLAEVLLRPRSLAEVLLCLLSDRGWQRQSQLKSSPAKDLTDT